MKKKKRLLVFLLVLSLILSSCAAEEAPRPDLLDPVNATLETAPVEYRQLSSIELYDGKVLPPIQELSFDISGYLYGLFVSPGEEVGEGEVIATIVGKNYNDVANLKSEIAEYKEENESTFQYIEAELELSRLSGADTSELELKLKHEKEQVEFRLSEMEKRLAELQEGDTSLHYIEAPYDCRIIATAAIREGNFVNADIPLAAIEGNGDVMVTCEFIAERTINSLNSYYAIINGKEYELEYIPYTKQELKDYSTKDITPDTRFRLVNNDGSVSAGDYAKIVTVSDTVDHVLAVPLNAVYSDSTGKFVYEVVDNVRVRRQVKTGISDSIYIEILEGLTEGGYVYVKN